MQGIAEAIDRIRSMARVSIEPYELTGISSEKAVYAIDGEIIKVPLDVPARREIAGDLDSFIRRVNASTDATVWHLGDEVVGLWGFSEDRCEHDQVRLNLSAGAKYQELACKSHKPRPHKEFVQWLVQNFRDELDEASPGLLATLRSLKFRTEDELKGSVQQGRESMGRSIEHEIAGAADLPETVMLKLQRWVGLDCYLEIECLLALDTEARTLALKPLADEVSEQEIVAGKWLGEQLTTELTCPVYHGSPNAG